MQQRLINMYQARLDGLSTTINSLHSIVGNDEALRLLDQPHLLQYRIDRLHELVSDILQSQKEQVILHLLNKVEQLQQNQPSVQGKLPPADQEAPQLRQQFVVLKQQLAFQRHTAYSLKLQLQQQIQILQKENKEKDSTIVSLQTQLKEVTCHREEEIQQKKKQLQEALRQTELEKKEMEMMKLQLAKQRELAEHKSNGYCKDESIKTKIEKMETLKKEMLRLSQELQISKEMVTVLKRNISVMLKQELHGLRDDCNDLKEYVLRCVEEMKSSDSPQESLLSRMVKLEHAMGSFIQSQGLQP